MSKLAAESDLTADKSKWYIPGTGTVKTDEVKLKTSPSLMSAN